jgi:hypothetical protein
MVLVGLKSVTMFGILLEIWVCVDVPMFNTVVPFSGYLVMY